MPQSRWEGKLPKTRPATRRLAIWWTAARPFLLYGALLAAGALALTWLDYLRFARTFPGELQLFLIAAGLNVSQNTVKTHVARVLEKLEVSRRTAALARARELGLLP